MQQQKYVGQFVITRKLESENNAWLQYNYKFKKKLN